MMRTMEDGTVTERPIWAKRIAKARGKTSQEAFAAQVGLSVATISRMERGIQKPRWGTAMQLSEGTGKPASYFLGEDEEEEAAAARIATAARAMLAEAFSGITDEKANAAQRSQEVVA